PGMRRIFVQYFGGQLARTDVVSGHRPRVVAVAGAVLLLVALAVPAGIAGAAGTKRVVAAAHHASTSGKVTYALEVGEDFSWILPIEDQANYQVYDAEFADAMWTPLFASGHGSATGIDYPQSIGEKPVYSDGDRTVTVTMRHGFTWSDGSPVTTADVKFFFEVFSAGKKTLGEYIPGEMPDDVTGITYTGPYRFTLHLNRAYSPLWFTDNQLTWIIPLPAQTWDRTCSTCASDGAASTPSGARKVFDFLFGQSKKLGTYATNPLWKTVDGPWKLTGYETVTHDATFSANHAYHGPTRPHLSSFEVLTYTTSTAELDALHSGALSFGWIPQSDWSETSYFKSNGYTVKSWKTFYNEAFEFGYTSKTWGPLVRQLYLRQALQHLVNEPLFITRSLHGAGLADYGPVADYPGSPYVAPAIRTDPYPYSPSTASKLLTSHGWSMGADGVDVCKRPGTAARECGKGIKKGEKLSLRLMYETGTTSFLQQVSAFQTAAKTSGVSIELAGESLNTMYSIAGVCPTASPCNYALAAYAGYLWPYSGNTLLPTGKNEFGTGNFWAGGYDDAKAQRLIDAADHRPGLAPLYADESYLSKDVASLWWPEEDEVVAVSKHLHGWQHLSPYGTVVPSMWSLSG
ncbi:MAG: ABC transporter substrate-binding protein, partial [Steroidobacteraceae bacterium]